MAGGLRSTARPPRARPVLRSTVQLGLLLFTAFLLGLASCSAFFLWQAHAADARGAAPAFAASHLPHYHGHAPPALRTTPAAGDGGGAASVPSILDGLRVLVAIASYDFLQLSHLEEVLDGFQDLCYAGAQVDVVVYTTVLYPVALIDMFNDRLRCHNPSPAAGLTVTLRLKPSRVRLHLVDFHRALFYERLERYDVFVYTEDDIRVSPKTVAAYLHETRRVASLVGPARAADFNVGIVRYEYDYPEDVVLTDKTRHANVNVTRVYWEHLGKPVFGKAVEKVAEPALAPAYVSMCGPHQGMYLATPALLAAWRDREARPRCRFDEIRDRPSHPSNPSQPTEGTQRVWMSSQMLYGGRHCAVTQLLPVENFGQLTVLHLPNKNYRRVGKQGRLGGGDDAPKNEFRDGSEVFRKSHPDLLKGLELHVEMRRQFPDLQTSNVGGKEGGYAGIRMVDTDIDFRRLYRNHKAAAEQKLAAYKAYVDRGGYMVAADMDIDLDAWRTTSSV